MENSNSKKTTVEKSGGHSRRNLRRTKRSTAIVEQSDSEDSENIYPKLHIACMSLLEHFLFEGKHQLVIV